MTTPMMDDRYPRSYRRRRSLIAGGVVGTVAVMLGLSFAAVPLYRSFCAATGFGGTPQRSEAAQAREGARSLTVRFDANVAPGLPWSFAPETASIALRTGKTATVFFHVKNLSDKETIASAAYNVTPEVVGEYFDKIACFCFSEQRLAPGEAVDMPVVFFLDPALERDRTMAAVDTVTLSYTFFAPKTGAVPQKLSRGGAPRPNL